VLALGPVDAVSAGDGGLAGALGVLMATPLLVLLAGMLYMEKSLGEPVDLP
jgi:hypothetical protein